MKNLNSIIICYLPAAKRSSMNTKAFCARILIPMLNCRFELALAKPGWRRSWSIICFLQAADGRQRWIFSSLSKKYFISSIILIRALSTCEMSTLLAPCLCWSTTGTLSTSPMSRFYTLIRLVSPSSTSRLLIIIITIQVLMPGGPKLTPSDPEKKKVMDKWVDQGAMTMRSVIKNNNISIQQSIVIILLQSPARLTRRAHGRECQRELETCFPRWPCLSLLLMSTRI